MRLKKNFFYVFKKYVDEFFNCNKSGIFLIKLLQTLKLRSFRIYVFCHSNSFIFKLVFSENKLDDSLLSFMELNIFN